MDRTGENEAVRDRLNGTHCIEILDHIIFTTHN